MIKHADVVSTRTKKCFCVECGIELSGATGWEGVKPYRGAPCVCLGCGHLGIFANDMTVREPTSAEIMLLAASPAMLLAQKIAGTFRAKFPEKFKKR
jgi:hypothetical protein